MASLHRCLIIGMFALAAQPASAQEVKRVLILYSNESLLPANISLGNALVTQMREGLAGKAEFYSEFLDLARFSEKSHQTRVASQLSEKYRSKSLDLVVTVGPQALDLMAAHSDATFPKVPLVFTGVRVNNSARQKLPRATGILMRLDPVPTLELALRLQPEVRRVVVVTGAAEFDRAWETVARVRFQDHQKRLEFTYLSGLSVPKLEAELRALRPDSIVLYLSMLKDGDGRYFISAEAAPLIVKASAVPVYGLYDTYMGSGIVGGSMDTFDHVGRETARVCLRVLSGERPEQIAAQVPGDSVAIVDWRQLRKWGLSEASLPPGSEVRFRQPSVWEEHRAMVLAVVGVFVLQAALLVGLLVQRRNRRRAENEVRRQEERFRSVVESTPTGIVMVNERGDIVLVNSHAESKFGRTRAELIGQPVENLVPERSRAILECQRADITADTTMAHQKLKPLELCCFRKDGSQFPAEVGLTRLQTGEGLFVLFVIVDITDRKEAEETKRELAHAARLTMVGELTASIAHEINQPLGAILSNADAAEMLLDSSPESLAEVRQILEDIRKDDLRASEVIRRLRILLRKHEMEMRPVILTDVITDVLGLIGTEIVRRGFVVETQLASCLPQIRGDKVHLQQVLLNLLLNGMEAMTEIAGARRLTVISAVNESGAVEVAVGDQGAGIAPEAFPHLFHAFFSTKKLGMGLGLSIARSIVEAHGGRIRAENNPGGGATFRFTLPMELPQDASARSTPNERLQEVIS